ncbi:MAG TPA: esterase [Firmicutes bacterium]|jgi:NTE family protein|nr:esterase [Bacillota bacterium]
MTMNSYPKIVLALGGGGARGFAHIGVLQVIKEAGIHISGVVGTSMGALIGATYCAGTDLYYLGQLVEYFHWEDLIDLKIPNLGLIDGAKVKTVIDLLTKKKNFEELSIGFWAVATDLFTGEEVVFKNGPMAAAVRASISIPGVFNPVELNGRTLVDGAVVAGVPVIVAKQLKGDITVAVNVGFDHTQHHVNNIFDVMSKVMDIMGNKLDAEQVRHADVTITPQLGNIGTMHFQKGKECMTIGRQAAEKILPELEKRIANFIEQEDQVS